MAMGDTTTTDIVPTARFLEGPSASKLTDEQMATVKARAEGVELA